jgi:GTP-binding protein LepA
LYGHIRNFAIIAHIDHGKSTLSDRLLELTGSLTAREMQAQVLDAMDLERERGITIKAHTVRMMYKAHDGETYQLNLIDTPGHVDFSYEVSRSLASCEGALLVVDASQGVEAQTLANAYLAIANGLEIIPSSTRSICPRADIERTKEMIEKSVGLPADDAVAVSAKTGLNVAEILEAVVTCCRRPRAIPKRRCRRSSSTLVRSLPRRHRARPHHQRQAAQGHEDQGHVERQDSSTSSMGVMTPKPVRSTSSPPAKSASSSPPSRTSPTPRSATPSPRSTPLRRGAARLRRHQEHGLRRPLHGRLARARHAARRARKAAPQRRQLLLRARSSVALGFGFRCGFLGLLHLEIIQERLEREYDLDLITTAPGVRYKITSPTAPRSRSTTPRAGPTPPRSRPSKSRSSSPRSSPTKSTSAAS